MSGVALEVLLRLLIADRLAVMLQLGEVHVKGGAPVGEICMQGHYAQGWPWAPGCFLQPYMLLQSHAIQCVSKLEMPGYRT